MRTKRNYMLGYFSVITKRKIVLWCYLIWYGVTVCFHFDPAIRIWLNSVGISLVIGIALMLSVTNTNGSKVDPWQTVRLFMMPFCVSSFSSLIKGQGFFLIVPPRPIEQIVSLGACLLFVMFVGMIKLSVNRSKA